MTNPATGEVSAQLALASESDVNEVVAAAAAAFPRWRDTSLAKRTQILFAFRELLNARKGSWRRSSPPSTARCSPTRWAR